MVNNGCCSVITFWSLGNAFCQTFVINRLIQGNRKKQKTKIVLRAHTHTVYSRLRKGLKFIRALLVHTDLEGVWAPSRQVLTESVFLIVCMWMAVCVFSYVVTPVLSQLAFQYSSQRQFAHTETICGSLNVSNKVHLCEQLLSHYMKSFTLKYWHAQLFLKMSLFLTTNKPRLYCRFTVSPLPTWGLNQQAVTWQGHSILDTSSHYNNLADMSASSSLPRSLCYPSRFLPHYNRYRTRFGLMMEDSG